MYAQKTGRHMFSNEEAEGDGFLSQHIYSEKAKKEK
jgi:hypothetical protein